MLFALLVIALFGLQLFKGALRHKCILNMDADFNVTDEDWDVFIQNTSHWLVQSDVDTVVCGNSSSTGRCPSNYTCLPDVGQNPNNGYTNFDHFGWAFITSFQLITLDHWENTYNLVLRACGLYYVLFFTVVIMFGSYYIINLVLAVVASSYEKESKIKEKKKKENSDALELWKRKEEMKKKISRLNPKDKFRLYGRNMSKGFSMEYIVSWSTDTSNFSAEEEEEEGKQTWALFKKRFTEMFCSWTCCLPYLKVQQFMLKIVSHSLCEWIITACIFTNTIILAIDHYGASYSEDLDKGNTVLTVIFIVEAFLKIFALNPIPYLSNGWNAFDFIIVLLSFLDWGLTAANVKSFDLSIMRSFRMLRVFKLAKSWKTLNVLITVIFGSLKEMGNLTLIVVIVIYIFAVIGMQLVGHDYLNKEAFPDQQVPRWNFIYFYSSFLMVFRILCGEWAEPLYDCMRCSKMYFCIPLFFMTYIAGNFLVLNLFLALLLNFFAGDIFTTDTSESVPLKIKFQRFLSMLKLRNKPIPSAAKVEPSPQNRPLEQNNIQLSGGSKTTDSMEDRVSDVKQKKKKCPPNQSSHKEIPTVSAQCRRYENGSSVMVLETLEEVQIEPEIEQVHSVIGKSKEKSGKQSVEHTMTEEKRQSAEMDELELEQKQHNSVMQPCVPALCSCCDSGQTFRPLRHALFKLVKHSVFEGIVLFIILVSTITLTVDDKYTKKNPKIQQVLRSLDNFYLAFFNLEMVLKISGLGVTSYFTNVWTLLDFLLVVIGWLGVLSSSIKSLRSLRSFRTLRALRPLRAISRWEGMRLVVNALITSIPSISNVMLVCLVFWLIFGIIGVQIYGGKFFHCVDSDGIRLPIDIVNNYSDCKANENKGYEWKNEAIHFDNIMAAYLALLQVSTFEGWIEIMASAADARGSRKEGALVMLLTEDQRHLYGALKRVSKVKPTKMIPAPKNAVLLFFYKVVHHKYFEPLTIILIVLNMLLMTSEHYGQSDSFIQAQDMVSLVFTSLFTAEAVLKLLGLRLYYFTRPWNVFDILVVTVSIVGNLLEKAAENISFSPTILRVFRVARLGRLLRLVRSLKGIRRLLFTLIMSIPALFNIGVLLLLVMFIYSILGMTLFQDLPRSGSINEIVNFETFANSMLLLFRLTTAAGWNDVLQQIMASGTQPAFVCILYMSSYILVTFIVIVNMYVAVILENFTEAQEQELEGVTDDHIDMFYEEWSKYDPSATQFISLEQLPDFLDCLKSPLRIPKPNAVKIAALNLPITSENKLHCLDILRGISCVIVGNVEETDPLRKLQVQITTRTLKRFPLRNNMQAFTTTLMIRKEVKAAMTIQRAFRKWQVRRRLLTAHKRKGWRSQSSF
ncbi:sodium channel protein type 3 subunit alpha-like isoform X2 [Acipenser ruthenus]|uniref:sodium channel protein type 3 subunit alpha-like isoform X2 n=1 Tax=Acipenser ruthenus TaxID=7906 RepID=UPI002740728A|nr:sodium channel protein type 3 subunit alpha-like isoform X2 [Acipenser ruthenus]